MYATNIKALLFDMDGVTIDSEKLYSKTEPHILSCLLYTSDAADE